MGLIARAIEQVGIPTIVVSIAKDLTKAAGTPRSVFVKWPMGHPLGRPNHPLQQRTIIFDALRHAKNAVHPGEILSLPYTWSQQSYDEPNWSMVDNSPK